MCQNEVQGIIRQLARKMKRVTILLLLACCINSLTATAQDTRVLASICEKADKAANRQQWEELDSLTKKYCALCDTTKASFDYSKILSYKASLASRRGMETMAIEIGQKVIDMRKGIAGCELRHIANAMNDEAMYYAKTGNYDKAVDLCGDALEIFKKHAYKKDPQYAVVMANMGVFLSQRENQDDNRLAIDACEKALTMMKKGTREYLNVQNNLAVCYVKNNNLVKAASISKAALKSGKKIYATDQYAYAVMLANHAARLANIRAYAQAMQYADEALSIFRDKQHTNTLAYAKLLVNRAVILTSMERYDDSIEMFEEALPLLADIVGKEHADYIRCVSEMSLAYNKKGNSEKAEEYSLMLRQNTGSNQTNDVRYARRLSKQADVLVSAGNYNAALQIVQTALDVFHKVDNKKELATTLNKIANIHIHSGNYTAAADSGKHAIKLLDGEKEELLQADINNTVAMAYYYMAQADTARKYGMQAIDLYKEQGDTISSIYAKALSNLALYNHTCGDTKYAIMLAERAKDMQMAILGADHPDNAAMLYNMARYYNETDSIKTQENYHKALQLQMRVVRDNFSHQTSSEREAYWNMKSYLFKAAPILAYIHNNNDSILSDVYNSQLFTKGLLLNSEINFHNFLVQTGDSVLLEKYDHLELLRRDIDAAYSLPPTDRAKQLESAMKEAAQLEKQLVRDCKKFGDFMAGLNGNHKAVSDALKNDEIAIEFMNLDVKGLGDTYLALYLKNGWDTPRCKVLFSMADLEDIGIRKLHFSGAPSTYGFINKLYSDPAFGQLVWGKLLPELDNIKTIYFAPSGMFYQLGVEYLAIDSTATISDKFTCHRLSSTRLITERTATKSQYRSAAVFGGLVYDMDELALRREHEKFKNYIFEEATDDHYNDLALNTDAITLDSLTTRGNVTYLPGTELEVQAIGMQLMQHDIPTNMFEQEEGTEEAFKALDGKGLNLIHIATHGFALMDDASSNESAFKFILQEDASGSPLSRSGLLLAGANYTLNGGKLPIGIENGILTAREISLLDLSGTELVVLSACRTGAGELKDDGVFGLQRGFKKAGVTTLIMSLWSVSDAATMHMMTAFYSGLMRGLSKKEAFHEAQSAVRSSGFSDPCYWAAFVMLDGI